MSTAPLARDADLHRLLDDGYDVRIDAGHLVVRHVPYVTVEQTVAYGLLAYPVSVSGDRVVPGVEDHRIWFGGGVPCDENGRRLSLANEESRFVSDDVQLNFMLSSKPQQGYVDQYDKVTAYLRILSHPAKALDPTVTATPGGAWQEVEDDLPFRYRDTASTRAGLSELNRVFSGQRIVIVGLGGSGSYLLDQVAKTPVAEIVLIDGDLLDNHNAFRAPGAANLDQLRERPSKVAYFAGLYGQMHTGIRPVHTYLTEANLTLLDGATFVFLALDDAAAKQPIIAHLVASGVGFIDIGLGVEEIDGRLSGLLRSVFVPPGAALEVATRHIPRPAEERDDYDRNIQIADLNCLNALLAVVRWKRHLGLYADGTGETLTTYSLYTNEISNETSDAPVQNLINNDPANYTAAETLGDGKVVVSTGEAVGGGPAGVDDEPEDAAA